MRCRVKFRLPADVQREVEPLLARVHHWVPSWVHELAVMIGDPGDDAEAAIHLEPEYRRAEMVLGAGWIKLEPTERQEVFVHEIAHLMTAPLSNIADGIAGAMREPERGALEEAVRQACEGVTCDLARAILAVGLAGCAPAPVHPKQRRKRRPSKGH